MLTSQCRVTSQDRDYDIANCVNVNTEQKSFYVRYDEVAPTVTVDVGTFMPKKSADHRKYEDVPLTITVGDNCDTTPEVTITVFSDETTVTHEFDDKPAAVLERQYRPVLGKDGVLQGWGLTLDRYSYAKKMCGPHMECLEADGRYYIVRGKFDLGMLRARWFRRWSINAPFQHIPDHSPHQPIQTSTVCAKDYAGLVTCKEDSVGVPLSELELKKIVPENQGKLFVVAEDRGFWNAPPNEIPFRNENLFLNGA